MIKSTLVMLAMAICSTSFAQGSGGGSPGDTDDPSAPPPGCFYAGRDPHWKVRDEDKKKDKILICAHGQVKGSYRPEDLKKK